MQRRDLLTYLLAGACGVGTQTYSALAATLMASDWWFFWWD